MEDDSPTLLLRLDNVGFLSVGPLYITDEHYTIVVDGESRPRILLDTAHIREPRDGPYTLGVHDPQEKSLSYQPHITSGMQVHPYFCPNPLMGHPSDEELTQAPRVLEIRTRPWREVVSFLEMFNAAAKQYGQNLSRVWRTIDELYNPQIEELQERKKKEKSDARNHLDKPDLTRLLFPHSP